MKQFLLGFTLFILKFESCFALLANCQLDQTRQIVSDLSGNKVVLVFGRHANPATYFLIRDAVLKTIGFISPADSAEAFLRQNDKALVDIKNQRAKFESYLPQLNWIGVESTAQYLASVQGYAIGNLLEILTRNGLNETKTESVASLYFGIGTFLGERHPQLNTVGLEGADESQQTSTFLKAAALFQSKMARYSNNSPGPSSKLVYTLIQEVESQLTNGQSPAQSVKARNMIRKLPTNLQELALEYINALQGFFEMNDVREFVMANNILQQTGTGIIFLGTAHKPGLTKTLTELCRGVSNLPKLPLLSPRALAIIDESAGT